MQLLKVSEVADMLRMRKETIYALIKDGELASIRIDRSIRVDSRDLDAFIQSHKERRNK